MSVAGECNPPRRREHMVCVAIAQEVEPRPTVCIVAPWLCKREHARALARAVTVLILPLFGPSSVV